MLKQCHLHDTTAPCIDQGLAAVHMFARIAQINIGTSACLNGKGLTGVPDIQCALADDTHYTLYR